MEKKLGKDATTKWSRSSRSKPCFVNEKGRDHAFGADRSRSSRWDSRSWGTPEKAWVKRLRELTKSSFGRERSGVQNDPSTSSNTRWSWFLGNQKKWELF